MRARGLQVLGAQEVGGRGVQPDGQPRSQQKFPPKLRWPRRDPGAPGSRVQGGDWGARGWGRGLGQRAGGRSQRAGGRAAGPGPTEPAAKSMRIRTPGANSQRQAPCPAWRRGSAGTGTHPLPTPARRGAQPRTRGARPRAPGLAAGALYLARARTLRPWHPHREGAACPGVARPAPGASFILRLRPEWGGSFAFFKPTPAPQQLPTASTFPSYLADGQTGDTKKKNYRPSWSHPPAGSREPGGSRRGSTSSLRLPIPAR